MGARRRAKAPTKADVARLANVSIATVSYVLNNTAGHRISERTQTAVREAARQLEYRPNLAARNLVTGCSGVVLGIIPRMAPPAVLTVGSRLTIALARRGLVLSLQFETDDARTIAEAIADLRPIAVAGAFPVAGAALEAVNAAGIPQIYMGSTNFPALESLSRDVGELRVEHLVARGHRRLGFAYSDDATLRPMGDFWYAGIRAAARNHQLPDVAVDTVAADGADAADVVARWHRDGVTAVCAQSDETAFAVLHGVRQAGLRCPHDLAVIGVDTSPLSPVSDPPLTSVDIDPETLVSVTVAAVLTAIGQPSDPYDDGPIRARLITRHST